MRLAENRLSGVRKNQWEPQDYLPTPEEIINKCREIQQGWTRAERLRRLLLRPADWAPPTVHVEELGVEFRPCPAH